MSNTIDEKRYIKVKAKLNKNSVAQVKGQTGLSESSLRRVKKSRSYTDFKRILVADRGPKYGGRSKPMAQVPSVFTAPKKRKWWERFFNV